MNNEVTLEANMKYVLIKLSEVDQNEASSSLLPSVFSSAISIILDVS